MPNAAGWETNADKRNVASWTPEPTIAERAAAYRADPARSFLPNRYHQGVPLFSPGFALLGLVGTGWDGRLSSIPFREAILLPASWMQFRADGAGAAQRNQWMTLRWRRI